jgi:hypothetical protein
MIFSSQYNTSTARRLSAGVCRHTVPFIAVRGREIQSARRQRVGTGWEAFHRASVANVLNSGIRQECC